MNSYKEIGGYFELECAHLPIMHDGEALFVNSARNALRIIIEKWNIKHIYLPYYTCPVVWEAVESESCKISPYNIDQNFYPTVDFPKDAFILYTNYFGICHEQVKKLCQRYPNLIVDNAQNFYAKPCGLASFNSPRKFFGLPDGGMLFTDIDRGLPIDATSHERCLHLLKRPNLGASKAYADFKAADKQLDDAEPFLMSPLTRAMLSNIDYASAAKKRLDNFQFLHFSLKDSNQLKFNLSLEEIPMVYPYVTDSFSLRSRLIENKIYIASYWPCDDASDCMSSAEAKQMRERIIPLPIDQRYSADDLNIINCIIHETL